MHRRKNSIGFSTGSVTSWIGSGSVAVGDRADTKAQGSHVLQNTGQHTGNDTYTSRKTISGVRIDLRAARLGGRVAGGSSKVTYSVKKLAF
jgi:hypothetical protein